MKVQPSPIGSVRSPLAAALFMVVVLLVPAGARANVAPPTTSQPVIAGVPQEGMTLTATATWTADPAPTVQWEWLRCSKANGRCTPIPGAISDGYSVTGADIGSVLRARVTVTNSEGSDSARSEPTAVVTAAPQPPAPTPTPSPSPQPTPSPSPSAQPAPSPSPSAQPTPSPSASPTTTVAAVPVGDSAAALPGAPLVVDQQPAMATGDLGGLRTRLLRPFPVVHIRGLLTPTGARVTLLTVRAPRGARIVVGCRGISCPVRRLARTATLSRLRQFERDLRAGTRMVITVTKTGYVGTWTSFRIRRGAPPERRDRCMYPERSRPTSCPEE